MATPNGLDAFFEKGWHPELRRRLVVQEHLPDGKMATVRYEWNADVLDNRSQANLFISKLVRLDNARAEHGS